MIRSLITNKEKRKSVQEVVEVVLAVWTIGAFAYKHLKKD